MLFFLISVLFYIDVCIFEFLSSTNHQKHFARFARNIPRRNGWRAGVLPRPPATKVFRPGAEFSPLKTGVVPYFEEKWYFFERWDANSTKLTIFENTLLWYGHLFSCDGEFINWPTRATTNQFVSFKQYTSSTGIWRTLFSRILCEMRFLFISYCCFQVASIARTHYWIVSLSCVLSCKACFSCTFKLSFSTSLHCALIVLER